MTRALIFILFGVIVGAPVGLGLFTFYYGKGYSYLSDDPKACMNCHVMRDQYESWSRSSHHAIATCNSCHTPGTWLQKYQAKASNGFWHSVAFTSQKFHEPIQIKPRNKDAVERSCKECHRPFLEASGISAHQSGQISCTRCHSRVGHAN